MTEKLGNISYTEDAALHPGAAFEERDGLDELKTELLLVDLSAQPQKETESPELDDEAADYTARELEARMIAGKIREMTDKERGITIWDKELGAYRRAQYGDIVILLRSVSGWAEEFIEVLATQGIPAVAESRTGYFNTPGSRDGAESSGSHRQSDAGHSPGVGAQIGRLAAFLMRRWRGLWRNIRRALTGRGMQGFTGRLWSI